ncbi:MAG: hypothetical protein EBX52_04000 [Proteobacteria bacterium]|nr:hypothetical protein [Pseudomonadota bacterium]
MLILLWIPATRQTFASGVLIEKDGRKYRVETEPELHRIRVVYDLNQKPYPTGLVLVLKRKNHLPRRIKLGLSESTRDSVVYSGLVPSNIQISGGITFEIGGGVTP